jgi:hypothetical protein
MAEDLSKKIERIRRDPSQTNNTRDPEFEIPDPEQVESDIEEAERLYQEQRKKA